MAASLRRRILGFIGIAAVAASACGQPAAPVEPAAPANPLVGAWSVTTIENADGTTIDPAQPGLFIFTDGYYSAVHTTTAEPRVPSAEGFAPTEAEMVAQYESLIVNTGTYAVSGDTVTFRPLVAKSPAFIGGESTATFDVAGDMLTLRFQSIVNVDGVSPPEVVGGSMSLTRVE